MIIAKELWYSTDFDKVKVTDYMVNIIFGAALWRVQGFLQHKDGLLVPALNVATTQNTLFHIQHEGEKKISNPDFLHAAKVALTQLNQELEFLLTYDEYSNVNAVMSRILSRVVLKKEFETLMCHLKWKL